MSNILFTATNQTITLGKKLGIGGEGAVYAVREFPDKVAKIYHVSHLPDIDKQNKLRFMADNAHSDLLGYIAWVEQTLHKRRGGRVIGFLMQKIDGCAPVHTLYNPSHRRQLYPKANWQFLLYTARNTAVAIATLHKHGHVIGDINQGNLLFAKNSKVTLIDADSFQIQTPDKTHLCQVGVAHFTPPELQGNTQFDRVARTQNHDGFGLALLIFHLLFGGRHPFSGVPLIDDAGNLLEHDIKNYRYAYAPDYQQRGVKPPPTAIPIGLVPKNIQQLFIRAFTEVGRNKRPSADEWVQALDALCQNLLLCRRQTLHIYPKHLSSCPWCALEKRGVVFFGKPKTPPIPAMLNHLPRDVHKKIAVYLKYIDALPKQRHRSLTIPTVDNLIPRPFRTKGVEIKYGLITLGAALFWIFGSFALMFLLQFVLYHFYHFFAPNLKGIYVFFSIVLFFFPLWGRLLWKHYTKRPYRKEAKRRQSQLQQARISYRQLERILMRYNRLLKQSSGERSKLSQLSKKYHTLTAKEKNIRPLVPKASYHNIATAMAAHINNINSIDSQIQAQKMPSNDKILAVSTTYHQALADFELLKTYL